MDFSRRGFIGFLAALSGGALAGGRVATEAVAATLPPVPTPGPLLPVSPALTDPGAKLREALRQRLGDDIYTSWLQRLEIEGFDGQTLTVSLPVKFLRNWVKSHWPDELLECCRAEFPSLQYVDLVVRQRPLVPIEQLRNDIERRIRDA